MATVVVTGANRGIGLEFARSFARRGDTVIAGVRSPQKASELVEVLGDNGHVLPLDIADAASIASFGEQVGEVADVDLLINNAATLSNDAAEAGPLLGVQADALENVLKVNVVGPVLVTQALATSLAPDARVVSISSGMGSIGSTNAMFGFGYSVSKTGLNMAMRQIAFDDSMKGRTVIVMSPGWVRTDMGGPSASLSPEESVTDMLNVIDKLTTGDTGTFFDHTGDTLPW